jgi:glutamate carboxypeptidase
VTPTAARAGRTSNTIPADGSFAVDVRVRTLEEQDRVDLAMRALDPVLSGARTLVTGGPNRPPLDADSSIALLNRIRAVAERLGQPAVPAIAVGGASDGNFTAGVGTPTLDGLGAVGGGAHADDEHVLIDELPGRTLLVRSLIADLLATPIGHGAAMHAGRR